MNIKQRSGQFLLNNNRALQFIGYEGSNAWLALNRGLTHSNNTAQAKLEVASASCLLIGSSMIWALDSKPFKENPLCLYYGGLSLAWGGLFFAAAGYPLAGLATTFAALETARGGAQWAQQEYKKCPNKFKTKYFKAISFWGVLINNTLGKIPAVGQFIKDRPLVLGPIVKAAFKWDYMTDMCNKHDRAGIAIGFGWLLGDFALALCDPKLRNDVRKLCNLPSSDKMPVTL